MKKVLSLVLALALLLSVTSVFAEAAEEKITLTLWDIATQSDANRPAYNAALAYIAEKYPNVEIKEVSIENQQYKIDIATAMADPSTLPDIFFTWSGAFVGDFVAEGNVYALNDVYANLEFKDSLPEVMLANGTFDGKAYTVPLTMNIVTLFANMDLLAKAGWDKIPETYEDLIKCCDDLVAAGITPFGCSGKETWCVTEYLEPIMEKYVGAETLGSIFAGKTSWKDEDIKTAVETFQDMIKKGYFDANGMSLGNDEVKANFIAGQYAFYQNGSWNCGEVNDAEGNFKVALFPVMNAERATYKQVIGGPSDSLAVSAHSPNAELAAKIAFELGKEICHAGYLAGSGLPAWTPDYDTSAVKPLVNDVAAIVAEAEGMVLFGDTAMGGEAKDKYLEYVSQVYGCEVDGEAFMNGLANDLW